MKLPYERMLALDAPDLQTQLEDILHAIWEAEKSWRLDDRIDLATRGEGGERLGT